MDSLQKAQVRLVFCTHKEFSYNHYVRDKYSITITEKKNDYSTRILQRVQRIIESTEDYESKEDEYMQWLLLFLLKNISVLMINWD